MERIFTPIMAQSSLDASLISMDTGALCGAEFVGGFMELFPPEPPPQAASIAPARLMPNNRVVFETMIGFSSNLTVNNSCRIPRIACAANACINGTWHLALTRAVERAVQQRMSKNSDSDD
jgi:hypothetical protein